MYLLPLVLVIAGVFVYEYAFSPRCRDWRYPLIAAAAAVVLTFIVVGVDYNIQITDEEVWSGKITHIEHKEEWKEWHKPYRDSDGDYHRGHWVTHDAENWIETSDGGRIDVTYSPSGKPFTNAWPNTTEELMKFWKVGDPSASVHTYKNYVQSSYSIYKHEDIDLKQFKGLPDYPRVVRNYSSIDRFVGKIPNKSKVLAEIAKRNTELNKQVPDPEKPGKTRSWKQVNLIFVNLGDVPETWGYALQDYWENGNKNDFVICFATDSSYNVKWVYPFSWADTQNSELLKIQVRDYVKSQGNVADFVPVVDQVAQLTSQLFERKQMAEFNYLKVHTSVGGTAVLWILMFLGSCLYIYGRRSAL